MTREIIICADDFAQNEAISEGILLLAKNKRINAISCLVNSAHWEEMHRELNPFRREDYIGLHLNFSLGQALSTKWKNKYGLNFTNFSSLIRLSYTRRLDRDCVEAEICAQLEAFFSATGRYPDFIDGHQHIHQLPVIRDALISVHKQKKLTAFCRNTSNNWKDFLLYSNFPKRQVISLLGGIVFKRLLKQQFILANSSFGGIYHFPNAENYRFYFQQFLKQSQTGGLIMCHPGSNSNDHNDPLHRYRHHELNYFLSSAFLKDLDEEQCRLQAKSLLLN